MIAFPMEIYPSKNCKRLLPTQTAQFFRNAKLIGGHAIESSLVNDCFSNGDLPEYN